MEMSNTNPIVSSATSTAAKTLESETDRPTQIQHRNGVLKRHAPLHILRDNHQPVASVAYKECQRNYAASSGGHSVDGCLEFMSFCVSTIFDPLSLKCAACGCHRSFHCREIEEPSFPPPYTNLDLEYQSQHRHQPPPPSPSPINMLMAISNEPTSATKNGKKRFRTKFSDNQKDKMLEFAKKIGWKMHKDEENETSDFCTQIGVGEDIFKVPMHNHKSTNGNDQTVKVENDNPVNASATTSATNNSHEHHNGENLIQHHQNENSGTSVHEQQINV